MKNFYEVGKVYVWQNLVGIDECLNGTETVVTGDAEKAHYIGVGPIWVHPTETLLCTGRIAYAAQGALRPKNPPSGEQSIADMFNETYCVPA